MLAALADRFEQREFAAGEVLVERGSEAQELFLFASVMSYLLSTYYSAAVLVPDALGILENVEIGRLRNGDNTDAL